MPLHYNYFRDYDPASGRYLQVDPIGLAGGLNTYGYANQNPVIYTDPKALKTTMVCRPVKDWRAALFGARHCAVFVWRWKGPEEEDCKLIIRQFSLAANRTPFAQGTDTPTFNDDTKAFFNPGNGNEHHNISPPNGMSEKEFDDAVTKSGENYDSGEPYNAKFGPNSNTAADNIIEGAGGVAPDIPGAFHQNYGE
jgi:uncharacterized protein RhaS with RHS repeats